MNHVIEQAKSGRSRCRSCGLAIQRGGLRLSEAFTSEHSKDVAARFHHLRCAASRLPYILRQALAATELEITNRAALEQEIESALSAATDVAAEEAASAAEYRMFVAALARDPDDLDARLVFADWLQSVGDPRGQLIAIQTRLETAPMETRVELHDIERALMAEHRRRFVPDRLEGKLVWQRGFVNRIELSGLTSLSPDTLGAAIAHPSFGLLREVSVDVSGAASEGVEVAANLATLPPTVRVLELAMTVRPSDVDPSVEPWLSVPYARLGNVSELAARLPALRRLRVRGVFNLEHLAHPVLGELEIEVPDADVPITSDGVASPRTLTERIAQLTPRALPALRRLTVFATHGGASVKAAVAATDLAAGLDELRIESANRPERLERAPVPVKPELSCDWLVRHKRRPEWGIGRVVDEGDDGFEVEFEHVGRKQIRGRELLEDA